MTTVSDDDDQREGLLRERRTSDLLARLLLSAYVNDETIAIREEEEEEEEEISRATELSRLRKRKVDASSPSFSTLESKRRLVVPNEPTRAEPVREIKPVIRVPVRREAVRQPVIRERVKPEWLVNLMREENGVDAKLIIEKDLRKSDLATNLTRLLIPWNQMAEMDFLTEAEQIIIDDHFNRRRLTGVDVILVDSNGGKWNLNLRRWDMKSSSNYVLITGWRKVCLHNRLRLNQRIHLWSFRSRGRLYFALVPPAQAPAPAPGPVTIPAPAMAQDLEPVLDAASSSAQAPVVTRNSDELYIVDASLEVDEESRRRIFVDFPRRRRGTRVEVPAPAPTRDSSNVGQSIDEDLDYVSRSPEVDEEMASNLLMLAAVAEADMRIRSTQVPVPAPAPTRDSGNIGQSINEDLDNVNRSSGVGSNMSPFNILCAVAEAELKKLEGLRRLN
ncbi:unnamed protein product [Microthlaspi erraticum]|uniref:TF-B3 domain-containing protein n=1 Tax=Microthlaspi erraticum TaxID=1685480 RepID=A0A6D2IJT2_9BRAS|nr:unnamed protein product [Microthlaspi erraticum]CAA7041826.1 unnamed protein product [Microthlaspi erraticum]CAA7045550.1 unnamed protein product [Microthlaspi erraticum]